MHKIIQYRWYADAFHARLTTVLDVVAIVLAILIAAALTRTHLSSTVDSTNGASAMPAAQIQDLQRDQQGHSPSGHGRKFDHHAPGLLD